MTNNQGEIFRKHLKANDIKIADLIAKGGISRQTVHTWYKVKEFSPNQLAKLEKAGISKDIFTNVSQPPENLTPVIKNPDADHKTKLKGKQLKTELGALDTSNLMYVPFINQYAYAGYLSGYGDQEFMDALIKIPFIVDKEYKGNYICLEVKGDSMDDGSKDSYSQGDHVLLREIGRDHWRNNLHIKEWDFVIVHDESMVLKKIIKHDIENGTILCHSLNSMYPDFTLHLNEVHKIFNVIKHVKNK